MYLKLDKSSVSNGETNRQGNNAGNQTSTVSNYGGLINLGGVGGNRGKGSGERGKGSSALVLFGGLGHLAGGQGLEGNLARGGGRGKGRSAREHSGEENKLVGLHFLVCFL
jgi:hypothetical protein